MPTRLEAIDRIIELLEGPLRNQRTLVGFDFAIGYPLAEDGVPVLPVGRELCRMMDAMVTDDRSGINNRFQVAAHLNQVIKQITGAPSGPFWGRPKSLDLPDLPLTRPSGTSVHKLRHPERLARNQSKTKPKSPWQLTGAGSVGGQSLVGLKAVHQLLVKFEDRAVLWPFEQPRAQQDAIIIAEVYPSLFPEQSPSYWFKDARQVVDARDGLFALAKTTQLLPAFSGPDDADEGWIVGVNRDPAGA